MQPQDHLEITGRGLTLWHMLFGMGGVGILSILITKFWEQLAELVVKSWFWLLRKEWKGKEERQQDKYEKERRRFVVSGEFDTFKSTTAARFDDLGRIVHTAAADMTASAHETRETLRLFDIKAQENFGTIHEKVNTTREDVSGLKKQMDLLPDAIVGKVLLAINNKRTGTDG